MDSQNQNIVIISYAVMFCYITLALGKFPHPVFTRALLGLQGIIIVALSVVCAIGVCSWAGMHITMIVNEVVPFLILALGAAPRHHRCRSKRRACAVASLSSLQVWTTCSS